MIDDSRKNALRQYWLHGQAQRDLQDKALQTLRNRAIEVRQDEELTKELIAASNLFSSQLANADIKEYRRLTQHGDTRNPNERLIDGQLRAVGRRAGTERMFGDGSVGDSPNPVKGWKGTNPQPARGPVNTVIASKELSDLAELPEGSTFQECTEALAKKGNK